MVRAWLWICSALGLAALVVSPDADGDPHVTVPVPTSAQTPTPTRPGKPSPIPRPAATALHVEYSAPGNCPSEADFEARVRARTELALFSDEPGARTVEVVVRPMGFTYAGRLSLVGRSGHISDREVEDTLCTDVVDALAFVTALAVDPDAKPAPSPVPAASPPTQAGPGSPLALAPPPPPPPGLAPALAPAPTPVPLAPTSPAPALSRSRWTGAAGASFVIFAGVSPDALTGGGVFGEIEYRARGVIIPSARLTVSASENGAFEARKASFILLTGRADVCPVRFGTEAASIRACLAGDLGALRGEGIVVPHPDVAVGFWADGGALLRARWAPLAGWFFIEAEAGLLVPAIRKQFVFEKPIYDVDQPFSVVGIGSFAAGVRFQ